MQRALDFLQPGEMPVYDKEPGVATFCIGKDGQNILVITAPHRMAVPYWPLVAKAPIRQSMTETAVNRTGAVLCHSLAKCITERVLAVVDVAKAEGTKDVNGEYTLVVPVMQTPVVYFGPAKEGKLLELVVEIALGIAAFPVAEAAQFKRFDQLPAETATEETFLVDVEADWCNEIGRDAYAGQLRKAARLGFMGVS